MNINLPLSAEIEQAIRLRATLAGEDVDAFLLRMVTDTVAAELEPAPPAESAVRRSEQLRERLEAWTALHPTLSHPIDDSRESIYAGRGE